jgi:hypothetical protein
MPITLDDVHVVYPTDDPVSSDKLDELEDAFGVALPTGYREYLTRLGHGSLNDDLHVYCPEANLRDEQRRENAERFGDWSFSFDGPELTQADIDAAIQVGVTLSTPVYIACPRFPGKLFKLDWGGEIICLETGFEILDPLSGMLACGFAFFHPLSPAGDCLYFASTSKRLEVEQVTKAFSELCSNGRVHAYDVPDDKARSPHVCLLLEALGTRLQVFRTPLLKQPRVQLQAHLPEARTDDFKEVLHEASERLGVKFKPARAY